MKNNTEFYLEKLINMSNEAAYELLSEKRTIKIFDTNDKEIEYNIIDISKSQPLNYKKTIVISPFEGYQLKLESRKYMAIEDCLFFGITELKTGKKNRISKDN